MIKIIVARDFCPSERIEKHIIDNKILEQHHKEFLSKKSTFVKIAFEPYQGHLISSLNYRDLLPSFLKKNKLKILANIQCESHRERLIYALKKMK